MDSKILFPPQFPFIPNVACSFFVLTEYSREQVREQERERETDRLDYGNSELAPKASLEYVTPTL